MKLLDHRGRSKEFYYGYRQVGKSYKQAIGHKTER